MGESDKITTRTYQTGEIIFNEGERGKNVYLVLTGSVAIYKTTESGRQLINTLGSGEIFGEMGLITKEPRCASARAEETTRLIVIDDKIFHSALLNDKLPIIKPLTRQLVQRLREAEEQNQVYARQLKTLEDELLAARRQIS